MQAGRGEGPIWRAEGCRAAEEGESTSLHGQERGSLHPRPTGPGLVLRPPVWEGPGGHPPRPLRARHRPSLPSDRRPCSPGGGSHPAEPLAFPAAWEWDTLSPLCWGLAREQVIGGADLDVPGHKPGRWLSQGAPCAAAREHGCFMPWCRPPSSVSPLGLHSRLQEQGSPGGQGCLWAVRGGRCGPGAQHRSPWGDAVKGTNSGPGGRGLTQSGL